MTKTSPKTGVKLPLIIDTYRLSYLSLGIGEYFCMFTVNLKQSNYGIKKRR